ncbi:MAG TPA: hypothetical protein VEK07_20295 [Polyangiaceae bacterium]|nr:hypothetical protein [Polyangiaceae bacterium]
MRMPEYFDDPSDLTVPDYSVPPYDIVPNYGAVPDDGAADRGTSNLDSGSLRPHVFSSDDWALPTRMSRFGPGPFLALGVVVGMAAALPITAWAVHAHRWPNAGAMAQGSSLASRPTTQPATAATGALAAIVPAPSPLLGAAVESTSPLGDARLVSNEKPHKKRTAPAKHPALRTAGPRTLPASDARETHGGAAPASTGVPATRVEDQAAAELSMSLK